MAWWLSVRLFSFCVLTKMIRNEFGPRSPRRARTSLSLSLVLFFLGLPLGGVRALTKTAARSLRHVVESQEHSGGDDVSHGPGGEHVHKGHACWEYPREKERKNRVARSVSLPNFPNRQIEARSRRRKRGPTRPSAQAVVPSAPRDSGGSSSLHHTYRVGLQRACHSQSPRG